MRKRQAVVCWWMWHARGWDLAALWVVVCGGDTNDDGRGGDGDGVVIGLWKNTQGYDDCALLRLEPERCGNKAVSSLLLY